MSKDQYFKRLESLFSTAEPVEPEPPNGKTAAPANGELNALRARAAEAEAALLQARQQSDAAQQLESQFRAEADALRERIAGLESELAEARRQSEATRHIESQQQSETAAQRERIADLEAALAAIRQRETLQQSETAAARNRIAELEAALTEAHRQDQAAQQVESQRQSEAAAQRERIADLEATLAAIRQREALQQSETAATRNRLTELEASLTEARKQNRAAQQTESQRQSEAAALRERIADLETTLAAIRQRATLQQSEVAAARNRITELEATLVEARQQYQAAQQIESQRQSEAAALRERMAELEAALAESRQQSEAARQAGAQQQAETARLQTRIAELETTLSEALKERPAARQPDPETSALRRRVAELEAASAVQPPAASPEAGETDTLFGALSDLIIVYDSLGRYQQVMPTKPALLYRPTEELLGRTVHEVLPVAKADEFLRYIRGALKEQRPVNAEYSLLIENEERWFEVTVTPRSAETVYWIARDITERRQAEEHLRASEQRYHAIADTARDAIISADSQGRIVGWNKGAERIFGYAETEAVNQPLSIIVPERYRDAHHAGIERVVSGGEHHIIGRAAELHGLRKDGVEIPIELSLSAWKTDEGQFFSAIIRDITERHHAQEVLQHSENRYRGILEDQVDLIDRFLPDGTLTFANDAFCRYFGITREERIGKTIMSEMSEAGQKQWRDFVGSFSRENPVSVIEAPDHRPDGETIWLRWHTRALFDSPGNIVEFQATGRDITEEKKAEERLLRQSEYLAALQETTLGLVGRLELTELLEDIVAKASELVGTSHGYIFLHDPDEGVMRMHVGVGTYSTFIGYKIKPGGAVVGTVWETGQPLVVDDYQTWAKRLHLPNLEPVRATVGVPLKSGSEVTGVLGLAYVESERRFGEAELDVIDRFAQLAAVALDNARLYARAQQELAERKLAEESVRRLSHQNQLILDAAGEGIFGLDAEGKHTFVNPSAARMLGYEAAELIGRPSHATWHHTRPDGSAYPDRDCPIYASYRTGVAQEGEEYFWRKDGGGFPVEFTSTPIRQDDEFLGAVVTFRDITERKRIEEQVKLQASALDSAGNAVVITTRNGIIEWVNPAFVRFTGYTFEEVVGRKNDLFKSGQHDQAFYESMWNTILSGQVWRGEVVNRRKDGTLYFEDQTITPVHGDHGEIAHFVSIKQDITERKQVEAALQHRARVEKLVSEISTRFVNVPSERADDEINRALQKLGGFAAVERTYLFQFSPDGATMDNTHEWCAEGVASFIDSLKGVPTDAFPYLMARIRDGGVFHIPRVADLPPEAGAEKAEFEKEGILSIIVVPVAARGAVTGFVGFDAVRAEKTWTDEDILLIRLVGEIFATTLERREAETALANRAAELEALNSIGQIVTAQIDLDTLLTQVGDKVCEIFNVDTGYIALYNVQTGMIEIPYDLDEGRHITAPARPLGQGLTSRVIETRKPLMLLDQTPESAQAMGVVLVGAGQITQSWLGVPIFAGQDVIGVVNVQHKEARRFDDDDARLMATIASNIGAAIQNARLLDQTQRRASELAMVAQISTAASAAKDTQQMLQTVVDMTRPSFALYHAHVYLLNAAGDTLALTAGAGEVGRQMVALGRRIPAAQEQSLVARAARTRQGVIVNDVRADPGFLPHPLLPDTRSEMAVPMIIGDQLLGVFDVQSDVVGRFSPEDINIQATLAAQVAAALQNARSYEQADRALKDLDALTRRLTREGWGGYLEQQPASRLAYAYDLDQIVPLSAGHRNSGVAPAAIERPLILHGETIGRVAIAETERAVEETEAVVAAVAEQLTAHIENLRLTDQAFAAQQQSERRAVELEAMTKVSAAASTLLDADILIQTVVDLAKESLDLYHVHIYLLSEDGAALDLAAGAGDVGRAMAAAGRSIPLNREHSLVARAARTRQGVIVNDVTQSPDFLPHPLLPHTRSELAVPVIVGDQLLGVFDVQADTTNRFTEEDVRLKTTLAEQVAVALQNARLYAEQASTVERLRELDQLKSSFLANMSHELRTPLNSIIGFTQVMLEGIDGDLNDRMENDLTIIQKNGQHLLNLISDILDMAKIEAGKMTLNPEIFDLKEVLDEVIEITVPFARAKSLEIALETGAEGTMDIYADRMRLRQVMINIVNNAIKFTESGVIEVKAARNEGVFRIAIHDSGIGIPASHLETVFQEFSQVDTSTTRKSGGTGLGLPISRNLIELHGGRLWAESAGVPGQGSTFIIELPLEAPYQEGQN